MCVLRVRGPQFHPVAYLAGSRLKPIGVYVPGDPIFDKRVERYGHADRGFHVGVSSRPWSDLKGQVEDATAFLIEHREELAGLSKNEAVGTVHLDFPTEADPENRHVTIWGGGFPASFLRAAADAGVDVNITLYFPAGGEEVGGEQGGDER